MRCKAILEDKAKHKAEVEAQEDAEAEQGGGLLTKKKGWVEGD